MISNHFIYKITGLILIVYMLFIPMSVYSAEAAKHPDFTIVIDPGHGGKDFGAIDNNVKEKDINLGVAKKLAAKIKKGLKGVKVVMTRDNDTFISLQERANIANTNKGNLFISIHTNSVDKTNPKRKSISGTSVYALGLHKDKNNLQVAQRENSVIELEKNYEQRYSGFDPSKDESYIIFEMAQKKNLGQSLKFADLAQKSLVKDAGRADRGVKQAGFWVLWATSMPSVLVELDFICNPNSAVYMGSDKGQDQLADALYKAVEKYVGYNKGNAAEIEEESLSIKENKQEDEPTHILSQSKRSDVKTEIDNSSRRSASTAAKRRRRSEAAKIASSGRNLETASIPLHAEDDRIAVAEVQESKVEVEENRVQSQATAKKTKGKSSKKGDKKKKEAKEIKELKANETQLKTHKSISGYHPKVGKLITVYKIQILASEERLKENNPRFCGLSPIKSFKEKNLYKYTYGESENRKDMEKLLKTVREKIPDAFIIKSMK